MDVAVAALGEVPEAGGKDVAQKEKQPDEESVKDFERTGRLGHRAWRGSVVSGLRFFVLCLKGGSDVGRCVEGESWAVGARPLG